MSRRSLCERLPKEIWPNIADHCYLEDRATLALASKEIWLQPLKGVKVDYGQFSLGGLPEKGDRGTC